MAYDGLGDRLSMTGFADGQSLTTQYVLDGLRVLSADADGNLTTYLYGLGPIGQLTDIWAYGLPDGTGTQRQLVDPDGEITLAASYTPSPYRVLREGDALSVSGEGNFAYGYFGGVMDTATGLLYVGNGQYYDPSTGRFLNRSVNPDSANPYVPWSGEPTGALIGPLVLLAMVYSRKKRRGKLDIFIILLVLCLAVGVSLAACGPKTSPGEPSPTSEPRSTQSNQDNTAPTQPPVSGTPGGETDKGSNPGNPGSGTKEPSADSIVECYGTPTPTAVLIQVDHINLSAYFTVLEKEYYDNKIPVKANSTQRENTGGDFLLNVYNKYTKFEKFAQTARKDFLYDPSGLCVQGVGRLENGMYIACSDKPTWTDYYHPDPNVGFEWKYKDSSEASKFLVPLESVAICNPENHPMTPFRIGDILEIPVLKKHMEKWGKDDLFKVTDTGGGLCKTGIHSESIDIFMGEGYAAKDNHYNAIQPIDDTTVYIHRWSGQ